MALHTDSTALAAFSAGQNRAATQVASAANTARGDLTSLTTTFGLIGAPFLAALYYAVDNQAARLDSTGAAHQTLASTTTVADRRYTTSDTAAGTALRASA